MTVRDVYIFESLGQVAPDVDCDDSEAEALDDIRYARRFRRTPLITERAFRRVARERRAAAIRDINIEDGEIEDAVDDAPVEETRLNRLAFGGFGLGQLGAALTIIGLLVMAAAWTGPSWGWNAGAAMPGTGAYEYGHGTRVLYAYDLDYADETDARPLALDAGPRPFIDPPRAMLAGGMLFLVGLALLATRPRRFLVA